MTESWAVLLAGVFAACAAVLGMFITKELKIAEFRQKWINDLRDVLCEFSSNLAAISQAFKTKSTMQRTSEVAQEGEVDQLSSDEIATIYKCLYEVKLRVNLLSPSKEERALVDFLQSHSSQKNIKHFLDDEVQNEYALLCASVLKKEWERVKKGSDSYVTFINLAWVLFGAFLLLLITYAAWCIGVYFLS